MKKSVNVILTLMPFALIAVFTAAPVIMTVNGSFFDINAEFVGFDNYAALLLSGISITAAAKAFLAAAIGFFADTLYVFCGVLGIGGIKKQMGKNANAVCRRNRVYFVKHSVESSVRYINSIPVPAKNGRAACAPRLCLWYCGL